VTGGNMYILRSLERGRIYRESSGRSPGAVTGDTDNGSLGELAGAYKAIRTLFVSISY
jgi:hypothetical protein